MVYKKEYLEAFLKNQSQLFDEPVAETLEEADAFLDDCMAVVADSFKDVKDYFEENGMDTAGLTKEELLEQAQEQGLVVMTTRETAFTACGLLYQAGLRGVPIEWPENEAQK